MQARKWLFGAAAALVTLAIAVSISFCTLMESMCGNDTLHEIVSPDGKFKVVTFQRSCGATTGFSTQASIVKAKSPLENIAGNVFQADDNKGAAPAGKSGELEVRVKWESPTSVVISHPAAAAVFRAEPVIEKIQVRYEKF